MPGARLDARPRASLVSRGHVTTDLLRHAEESMLEPKQLYKRIEAVFDGLAARGSSETFATRFVARVLDRLGPPLGLSSAHLYKHVDTRLELLKRWGQGRPDLAVELTRAHAAGDDARHPEPAVGRRDGRWRRVGLMSASEDQSLLMALFLAPPGELQGAPSAAQLSSALTSLSYAFGQHYKRRELEDLFAQARAIQLTLLPHGQPRFAEY